jgi:hypothetical protein
MGDQTPLSVLWIRWTCAEQLGDPPPWECLEDLSDDVVRQLLAGVMFSVGGLVVRFYGGLAFVVQLVVSEEGAPAED